MSCENVKFSEHVAIAALKVGTVSSTPLLSTGILKRLFRKMKAVLILGDMAAEDITFEVGLATDTAGSGYVTLKKAVTLSQTYSLASHASNNDNKVIEIDIDKNDFDPETSDSYTHIIMKGFTSNTVGGACKMVLLGMDPANAPTISQNSLNSGLPYKNRDDDDAAVVLTMR